MDSIRQLLLAVKKIVRKYSINQILLVGWSKWSDNSIRQFDENSDKIVNDANHLDQLYKMLVSHFRYLLQIVFLPNLEKIGEIWEDSTNWIRSANSS